MKGAAPSDPVVSHYVHHIPPDLSIDSSLDHLQVLGSFCTSLQFLHILFHALPVQMRTTATRPLSIIP